MCGIAGILQHSAEMPSGDRLRRMADGMRSRGPDDEGYWVADHVGLAHRRLSVRDLTPAGRCPMADDAGLVSVVFNGEIYNWRGLRAELEARGHAFVSRSDTEVIVRGFIEWGQDVFPRLHGMFAVGIWDSRARELTLARDRCGEKPLFYAETSAELSFASSLNGLAPALGERTIDAVAMACYLSHAFIPSELSIWRGVSVLPAAHKLTIRPGERAVVSRFWDFPRSRPSRRPLGECEAAVEAALDRSVQNCLDADVPVGVYLSGGVDSSVVAAIAARHHPGVEAFSLGFREAAYDEIPHARRVAGHLGLEHHVVEASASDVIDCLPRLVSEYGQPFGDASAVPSYLLARFARKQVTVCLSGDGGDESFGGYWRMQAGVYAARYGALVPEALRRGVIPRIAQLLGRTGARLRAMNELSLAAPGAGYTNAESWYGDLATIAGPLLEPALGADLASYRAGKAAGRPEATALQRVLYDDFLVQLPDAYLTKVDVASMAASLEVRAPLLDVDVIEMAWTLPDSAKLHWGRRKWLLKRIAERMVPPDVVHRPKMGFGLPLSEWFRAPLGQYLERLFERSSAASAGWIRADRVRTALARHRRGANEATRLWLALWLELWFRIVVEGAQPTSLPNC